MSIITMQDALFGANGLPAALMVPPTKAPATVARFTCAVGHVIGTSFVTFRYTIMLTFKGPGRYDRPSGAHHH